MNATNDYGGDHRRRWRGLDRPERKLRHDDERAGRLAGRLRRRTGNRQNLAYQWDAAGNLTQRRDLNQNRTEGFTLDGLDRVSSSTLNGTTNLSMTYDAAGNVTQKSDIGTYIYGDVAQPHAVTTAGSKTLGLRREWQPDARDGAAATLGLVQPADARGEVGTTRASLLMGPITSAGGRSRPTRTAPRRHIMPGGLLEKEARRPRASRTGGITCRLRAGHGRCLAKLRRQHDDHFMLTDHLGSSETLLDETGAALQPELHGLRAPARQRLEFGHRAGLARHRQHDPAGFTGHEMLDNLGLVHMNGRVYDPQLARFLSADPLIGRPG